MKSATNNMGFVYVYALPLQVPLNYLPRATQNAPYSTKLQTIGGAPPYIWSLAPGSAGLPSGLSLASSGVISGIPSAPGTNYFMVNVTDAMNTTTNQVLTLTVNASSLPPVISITGPTMLANGQFQFAVNTTSDADYTVEIFNQSGGLDSDHDIRRFRRA